MFPHLIFKSITFKTQQMGIFQSQTMNSQDTSISINQSLIHNNAQHYPQHRAECDTLQTPPRMTIQAVILSFPLRSFPALFQQSQRHFQK